MVRRALGVWTGTFLVFGLLSSGAKAARIDPPLTWTPGRVAWPLGQAPAVAGQDAIRQGATLFNQRCADCHGPDATGVTGPDLTRLWTSGMDDARVFDTIRFGRPGSIMPPSLAPDGQVQSLVAYLKSLGAVAADEAGAGDARRGQDLFSAKCSQCHYVNGQGGRLGPELSRIAETRSRTELRGTIRYPSAAVATGYRTVTLVTRDGQKIEGTRKGEDAFSVQIVDTRERLQGYLKADLREVIQEKRSLMPEFGADRLSESDLDDVLQYLRTLRKADGGQR